MTQYTNNLLYVFPLGCETKLSLNSRFARNKFSTSEKFVNRFLVFYVMIMIAEMIVSYFMKLYYEIYGEQPWDEKSERSSKTSSEVVQDIFSFLMLYNYLIPISLYVSIETQRLIGK